MYMYATKSDYEITVKTELGDKEGEKKIKGVGKKRGEKKNHGWLASQNSKLHMYIYSPYAMLCF